jgi:pimeloyl-ACP methyl ester carboxylesterase
MRAKRGLIACAAFAAVLVALAVPSRAEDGHQEPQKAAKVAFGPGFPALVDHEWGFALGGFGGIAPSAPRTHAPVIFVHGNNVDAADWYPVRDDFRAAGWTDQELWALSYNGLGANNGTALMTMNPERDSEHTAMGWDGLVRVTENEVNVADLYDLIMAVRSYTGSERFTLVGHSLGVTLARRTLKVHPELRGDLVAFVGIAGGNHGTSFCPPGSEGNVVSCDEIAAGTPWLAALNGTDGVDESYPPAAWMTVYDGSGAGDPAFAGPTYAQSPALKGADNRQYAGTYHNDLRLDPAIVADYRAFIEQAEHTASAAASGTGTGGSATTGAAIEGGGLPATGGGEVLWPAATVLIVVLLCRTAARRSAGSGAQDAGS